MLRASACNFTKVTLLHGCFSRFLNCTNGTKSRNVSHLELSLCKFAIVTDEKINLTNKKNLRSMKTKDSGKIFLFLDNYETNANVSSSARSLPL